MDWADAKVEEVYASEEAESRRILADESNEELLRRWQEDDHAGLPVGGAGVAISQVISSRLQNGSLTDAELEAVGGESDRFKPSRRA